MGDLEEAEEEFTHNLAGEWELHKSVNYDEFLQAIGANVVVRRIATQATPLIEIDQTGDQLVVRTLKGPFTTEEKFTVGGVPSYITEPDGQVVKLSARWTSHGLSLDWVPISGSRGTPAYTITRQPTLDDRLITKLQVGDIVCTRVFRKAHRT